MRVGTVMKAPWRTYSLCLLLVACGDNLDPPYGTEGRSGQRLKLVRYVYSDDTDEIETTWFHDHRRGETCRPEVWSDGHTYCTPEAGETAYVSPDCTALIGR